MKANDDFIFVIDPDDDLFILPLADLAQVRILFIHEYNEFQLCYMSAKLNDYYILYSSKDEDEVLMARNELYDAILKKKFAVDFSQSGWIREN